MLRSLTSLGVSSLPFPELGARVSLRIDLVLVDCRDRVEPRPRGGRAVEVHGAPIAHRAVLLDRADTLPGPRGHLATLAHHDALTLAVERSIRSDNRPVRARVGLVGSEERPGRLERDFHFRTAAEVRQHALHGDLARFRADLVAQHDILLRSTIVPLRPDPTCRRRGHRLGATVYRSNRS